MAQKPDAHGYSASKGIPGLRKAQANYYARRFGVDVDPETEVVVTMGSKEGLASLATAITAPGDVVLAPNPSYPIHTFGFIIAGATIRSVPTTPDENYFRALDRAMAFTVPRPSILVVNYPSNPTAETVDLAFYERLVAWAKENKVWILSDLAYSELYFDGNPTPSILQVKGAKDVAVEFTSLSKTYSMAGWRIGFAVGNKTTDRGDDAGEKLSRLRCLHANSGRRLRRAQWPAGYRREQTAQLYHKRRDVLGRGVRPCGLGYPAAACFDVCMGTVAASASRISAASNSPSNCSPTPRSRSHRASATARTARALSASQWSKTNIASARPRAM